MEKKGKECGKCPCLMATIVAVVAIVALIGSFAYLSNGVVEAASMTSRSVGMILPAGSSVVDCLDATAVRRVMAISDQAGSIKFSSTSPTCGSTAVANKELYLHDAVFVMGSDTLVTSVSGVMAGWTQSIDLTGGPYEPSPGTWADGASLSKIDSCKVKLIPPSDPYNPDKWTVDPAGDRVFCAYDGDFST
jgi:hypothetical protein